MKRYLCTLAALLIVMTWSIAACATETQKITLMKSLDVNGTTLQAGNYTLRFEATGATTKVSFLRGSKEVATAPAQLRTLPQKSETTQIMSNTESKSPRLSEINFRGSTIGLTFSLTPDVAGK